MEDAADLKTEREAKKMKTAKMVSWLLAVILLSTYLPSFPRAKEK